MTPARERRRGQHATVVHRDLTVLLSRPASRRNSLEREDGEGETAERGSDGECKAPLEAEEVVEEVKKMVQKAEQETEEDKTGAESEIEVEELKDDESKAKTEDNEVALGSEWGLVIRRGGEEAIAESQEQEQQEEPMEVVEAKDTVLEAGETNISSKEE